FLHDMLETAGGDDVLGDVKQQSVTMSTELVLARAPEVIVELRYTRGDAAAAADLRAWDALPSVPAVRNRNVLLLQGEECAVREGFTHAAFGDLFLEDIRRYREERLAGSGLTPLFPLFDRDPAWTSRLAREMVGAGLRARITCVDPKALDAVFAGREFDAALLADLPASVDPCGERGEFHTCTYAGPMFSRP